MPGPDNSSANDTLVVEGGETGPTGRARFNTPELHASDRGWGPCFLPEDLKQVPFAMYYKSDRINRAADWHQPQRHQNRYHMNQAGVVNDAFHFSVSHQDAAKFKLINKAKPKPKSYSRSRGNFSTTHARRREREENERNKGRKQFERRRNPRRYRRGWWNRGGRSWWNNRDERQASVELDADWPLLETLEYTELQKQRATPEAGENLRECGSTRFVDTSKDKMSLREAFPLQRSEKSFYTVTASEDPVLNDLAASGAGNVFVTDTVLTAIMAATRSQFSWDVVITKNDDGTIFLDKRDNSVLDYLTVNESSTDATREDNKEDLDKQRSLREEATFINQNFSQQMLTGQSYDFPDPSPFDVDDDEMEDIANVSCIYRRFRVNATTDIVVRCDINGVLDNGQGATEYVKIHALNEYNPKAVNGIVWRQKLDSQRGAVLGAELKNNSNKLTRWTYGALLAGADAMKFGFVSRNKTDDNYNHAILGVQTFRTNDFVKQVYANVEMAWGIVSTIIEAVRKHPDGKYLLLKDPNKQLLKIYSVPDDAFEKDDGEDDDGEDDGSESE